MNRFIFAMFITCCTLYATNVCGQKSINKKCRNKCEYIEHDSIADSNYWANNFIFDESESITPLLNDANSVAAVAFVYVSNIYGNKIAKIEQPYHISLLNGTTWIVSGTSKPQSKYKPWKGNFYMMIDKRTGRILFYMHEK